MSEGFVVIFRAIAAFITLLIFARIIGKTQVSQLTFFEYIFGITIGSAASTMATSLNEKPWPIWLGLAVWTVLILLTQFITLKYRQISKVIDGEPTIIVQNGKILENNMRKMGYRISDLMQQLRQQNAFDIKEVEFAILETGGQLTVLKKAQNQALTPEDLKIPTDYKGVPTELIYDGKIVRQNLEQLQQDEQWLRSELRKLNIYDIKEVVYAQIDSSGKLYVDKRKDDITQINDISDFDGLN